MNQQELFKTLSSDKPPIIFLKDFSFKQLEGIIDYIYLGSVTVAENEMQSFKDALKTLKIPFEDKDSLHNKTSVIIGEELFVIDHFETVPEAVGIDELAPVLSDQNSHDTLSQDEILQEVLNSTSDSPLQEVVKNTSDHKRKKTSTKFIKTKECGVCKKRYKSLAGFNNHQCTQNLQVLHPMTDRTCPVCHKVLCNASYVKHHIATIHYRNCSK